MNLSFELQREDVPTTVRPAKTQISLHIRAVWSEALLSSWRNIGSLAIG